jgi:hypothetical protein
MKIRKILALTAALLGLSGVATAQQAVVTSPASRVTTNASSTIAVTDTFQQIWAAQSSRVNCGIQNNDTNSMWVYFGSGTPTKATSVVLAPGQFLNCATSGVVASSAVWITGTSSGVFYAGLDGAPIVGAPTSVSATNGQIGLAYSNALTITRPANQTPYTAGDVVGGALTFTSMGPSAGRIMLTSTQLEPDLSAIPTGMTSFFLALYNVTPPSALADNAPWDLPSGDRASFLGIVQLGTPVDLGSTLYVEQNIVNKQIKLAGTSLFGYLVTQTGFTPAANSEVYINTIHSVGLGL